MIAVIVPSKTASNLEACAWARLDFDPNCGPLIVVDDGLAYIPDSCDGATILKGVKPFVFARNMNLGITEALNRPRINGVLLLNDDAILETHSGFSLLERAASEHPEYGIIGAVTNVTGQPLQQPQGIGLREVEHFAFVCVYIPRSTIERVGLLDERYCLDYGCEDRDYCLTVRAKGLKVGVHDGCFVDHAFLTSSFRGDPHAPLDYSQNFELLKAKWGVDNFGNPA